MSDYAVERRPTTVTIAMVLAYISGIVSIIGGVVLILARNNPQVDAAAGGGSSAPAGLLVVGIVMVVIGLITVLVARGLGNGNNGTRIFVTVLQLITVVSAVFAVIQGTARGVGGSVVFALIVLFLLWNSAANRFFAARS